MAFKFCIVMEILSCRGGTGPVVSMLVFYYKNPCSNPAEVYSLVCKMLFEKNGTITTKHAQRLIWDTCYLQDLNTVSKKQA